MSSSLASALTVLRVTPKRVSSVGEGVIELRVHVGAGYRVYCAQHGKAFVILLCGGDKGSQKADINRAKSLWLEWKRRQR